MYTKLKEANTLFLTGRCCLLLAAAVLTAAGGPVGDCLSLLPAGRWRPLWTVVAAWPARW